MLHNLFILYKLDSVLRITIFKKINYKLNEYLLIFFIYLGYNFINEIKKSHADYWRNFWYW